jgi:tetratricopeptide (TPR) repeat protein
MLSLHESAAAHLHLVSGMKAWRLERPFTAVDHLTRALDLWKRYAYPKGTFDASLQLGDAYSQLGSSMENRMRAVLHYRLAERLGSRLQLARHGEAQLKLAAAMHRIAMTPAYLIKEADEQLEQLSYSQMMAGWSFPSQQLTKR